MSLTTASCGSGHYGDKRSKETSSLEHPDGVEHYTNGKMSFQKECSQCHGMPHIIIDGPNIFMQLFDRLPKPQDRYFRNFVMDGKVLKQSGDSYQRQLQETSGVSTMHDYRGKLTDTELEEILIFLKVTNRLNQVKSY